MKPTDFIWVFLGSGIGGCLRFAIGLLVRRFDFSYFPAATLLANFLACFLAGYFLSKNLALHPQTISMHLLFVVGLCGGFSTFSTFSFEVWEMIAVGKTMQAIAYIGLSIVFGLFPMWIFLRN